MTDAVNKPAHYTTGHVECIDAIEAATSGLSGIDAVCTANAIKYLWRWRHKNGVEDLRKAQWYLQRLIERQENARLQSTGLDAYDTVERFYMDMAWREGCNG